ncbi:hypothetical protein [Streptomyces sp. 067-1]|uniref:hypothetical protein n=1 Tax=Streptomyces sp. 067-1 TaxID=2789269 RepID=UPI0039F5ECCA
MTVGSRHSAAFLNATFEERRWHPHLAKAPLHRDADGRIRAGGAAKRWRHVDSVCA